MARIDIHRPSVINPTDYSFVAYDYVGRADLGDWAYLASQRQFKAEHMLRTGGRYSDHEHGGSCYVCGAHAIYTATFWHRPTNVYIRTGLECAEHMSHSEGEAFRRRVHEETERRAGVRKAKEIIFGRFTEAQANRIWGLFNAPQPEQKYEEQTLRDIVGKLVRYGSISDNAANYLGTLLTKIDTRAAVAAQRSAEQAAALPVPVGKLTVRGKVLSTKVVASVYGSVTKMLVQHADGWKVWGTVPNALTADELRGKMVEFSATVERSNDDAKFGFYKRPTKARVLEEAVA